MRRYHGWLVAARVAVGSALLVSSSWTQARLGAAHGAVPAAEDPGEWIAIAPLRVPRQEVGVAALEGKLYVIAGIQGGVSLSSVERYDPLTNTWSLVAGLPPPALDHVGAAAVAGKLYAIGGFAASGAVATVFEYDPPADRWTRRADLPTPRGAPGVAVLDGRIYVAGGFAAGDSVADFARYDPASDRWEVLPPMPTRRDHHAAVALNGRFHAIGGRRLGANLDAHEVFDPATGRWSALAPLPTPRSGLGAGTLRNRIQVFGGEGNRQRPDGMFAENEEYDPVTNTWRALAPMPLPRHGTGGAVIGDLLYVPAGGPREGLADTAAADAFRYRRPLFAFPPSSKFFPRPPLPPGKSSRFPYLEKR